MENGRCCVFQPFDKGPYDKRYEDTIAPAILATNMESYRVDRDDGAVIPIDTLHDEIKAATLCLADISNRNPNVMYEVGFAIASGKDIVLICSRIEANNFPFDIQHRGIIQYDSDSASDFAKLNAEITRKINALLKKQATTQAIVSASPVRSTQGLQPHEMAALALTLANADDSYGGVTTYSINQFMEKAGYTKIAAQLALTSLTRMNFMEKVQEADFNGEPFFAHRVLRNGEDWLLENQSRLVLRDSKPEPESDSEIPF